MRVSLLPIEEAVAAHQNPHLVSVGGAEPAGRGSGTAAPLSRSLLPLFSPPSARGYRCSGSRATMQPPTLTQVTQGPVVASRDGRTNGRMDRCERPSQEVHGNNRDLEKTKRQHKTKTLQTWTLRTFPLRPCFPTTANCLTFTLFLCLSSLSPSPSLALSRSLSLPLPLSLARWLPLERRED